MFPPTPLPDGAVSESLSGQCSVSTVQVQCDSVRVGDFSPSFQFAKGLNSRNSLQMKDLLFTAICEFAAMCGVCICFLSF